MDIGGTKLAVAHVSSNGDIQGDVLVAPTPAADGPGAVLHALAALLRRVDPGGTSAIGVAAAGVVDCDRGVVLSATSSIAGWTGTAVAAPLTAELGVPAFVLNDGHAFALGEAAYGAGSGRDSLLLLIAGTGVGGSYVRHGEPMFGANWVGGHFGHLSVPQAVGISCYCGGTGHLEAIASGAGMVDWYRAQGGAHSVSQTRELFERLAEDPVAREAVELGAAAFGLAAGSLVNAFDPDMVVVAGGLSEAGPAWEGPMRRAYAQALMPALTGTPLVRSASGTWPSLRGAAYFAMSQMGAV